ncbi:MAG: PulJ/GspJ family protein [Thermodesulfobacteriota bacterium]
MRHSRDPALDSRGDGGGKSGFTLLEILIAISIFAVLATMIYSAFNAVISKNNAIKGGLEVFDMGKTCLSRISNDLSGVYVVRYPEYEPPDFDDPADAYGFYAENRFIGSTDFSELRFVSTAHLPLGNETKSGLAQIRYYVTESRESETGYVLRRADTPFPYDIEKADFEQTENDPVLCEDIASLTLTFYDAKGDAYETWDSDAESMQYATPRAVKIELTLETENGSHAFSTRVALPVYREKLENVRE